MRRKEVAKKLGIVGMACMLAAPCTAPVICAASTRVIVSDPSESDQADAQEKEAAGLKLTTKIYEKEYQTDDGKIYKKVSFEYPQAEGSSEAAKTLNKFYKNLLKKWQKATEENLAEAEAIISEMESRDDVYSDQVTCKITSNDENYISVLQSGYDYTMGAHGTPYRYTYIFDAKTGKKASAANLLGMSKSQLNKKVRNLYLAKFDKTQKEENYMFYSNRDEVKATLDKMDFNQNLYYLKNGKVRFYADPYAVGPYAAGFIEVAVKL